MVYFFYNYEVLNVTVYSINLVKDREEVKKKKKNRQRRRKMMKNNWFGL